MLNNTNRNDKILTLCLKEIDLTPPAPSGTGTLVGEIKVYPANNVPEGYLECNGAPVSRTQFADLFDVLGTLYGAGDGVNTFNLPDLRGEFIRGFDNGRGIDENRVLGSAQVDELKSHSHDREYRPNVGGGGHGFPSRSGSGSGNVNYPTNSTGGDETRPRNIAMMYIIKF